MTAPGTPRCACSASRHLARGAMSWAGWPRSWPPGGTPEPGGGRGPRSGARFGHGRAITYADLSGVNRVRAIYIAVQHGVAIIGARPLAWPKRPRWWAAAQKGGERTGAKVTST